MTNVVLVTGGAGFIGSATVRRLVRDGRPVVNVDALTYAGNLDSLEDVARADGYAFENANIRDAAAMARIFGHYEPQTVLHLAAESHVDRSIDGPAAFVDTNVVGTYTLLETAHDYWVRSGRPAEFRFVHVSTDEVYGDLGPDGYFTETSPYTPNSPYSATKAAADHLIRAWHRTYGLPVITTNCSNNYGPYQFPEKLIPHMIISALEGKALPVYGDGGQIRDWLYVDDHVDALFNVVDRGRIGEVYAIGGRNEWRNLDLVRAICDTLDVMQPNLRGETYSSLITHVQDRPGHDRRYAIDPTKMESELGWTPAQDGSSGLSRTVRWYLDNEPWWRRVMAGTYRGQRLGIER